MQKNSRFAAVAVCFAVTELLTVGGAVQGDESRWEKDIKKFEQQDAERTLPKNGIVFVGSSSIRKWDLKKWFPDFNAINRGFGGSEVSDSVEFADRIILKYQPRVVVVYAGDNDLAHEESPKQVYSDYRELVALIHGKLPKTKIVYIAVKPSIKRWALIDSVRKTNRLISDLTRKDERLEFVDIDGPMLGADGMPRKELFVEDGLHLSDEGYELWTALVKPHLIAE